MYEFLDYVAGDVMSRDLVTVAPDALLGDVEAIFEAHDFNGLPVVGGDGRLAGWITKLDLLKAFRFDDDHTLPPTADIMKRPVSEVMCRDIATLTPRAPLTRVLEKLINTGNKSFPVIDDNRLVGIVAREDVLGALRRAAGGEQAPRGEPAP